ncbi:MAG TPA: hypothetical protein ENK91_14625, partial [Bacteroidetes bacterium]|nr:hypothetical protein [Bacteroidota bacterium]
MNNLIKGHSIIMLISIAVLCLSIPSKLLSNYISVVSPDVLNVQAESRCIPSEGCAAFDIKLNATVESCSNPNSLNWQYVVRDFYTDEIIQYSYNYIPVPTTGVQGDKNLDILDHTMNAELSILDSLSIGEYYVDWTVYDSLRNPYSGSQYFKIYDTEPPVLDIYQVKSIHSLDNIYAISFDKGYDSGILATFDNCKESEELYFTFSPVLPKFNNHPDRWNQQYDKYGSYFYDIETGNISSKDQFHSGQAFGWDPDLKSSFTTKNALCNIIVDNNFNYNWPYYLKIYAWDDFNESNDCDWNSYAEDSVLLGIECYTEPPYVIAAGEITTLDDNPVENMEILVDDGEERGTYYTDNDGNYQVEIFGSYGSEYQISASKNSEFKKGISTLDILLIRRYILGQIDFDNPYNAIAADVNGDNKISANDIIQLVHLLIGKKDDFNNVSYLGILKNYNFKQPSVAYKETNEASTDTFTKIYSKNPRKIDFWAIKIGDVNQSSLNINSRDYPEAHIYIEEKEVKSGDGIINIPVKIKDMDDLEGLQLAFNLDGLEFHDIKSSNLNISKNNYNIRQGKLLISVGEVTKDHIKSSGETTLFELSVIPQKSGRLSNMIALDNEVLHGELYRGNDLEINNISLDYRTSKNKFELYQNYPNPFNDQTTIRFSLKDSKEYII